MVVGKMTKIEQMKNEMAENEKLKEHLQNVIADAQEYIYEITGKDYSKLPDNLQNIINILEDARYEITGNL